MVEFAKNTDDPLALTDEQVCAGFSACPEGDEMPMLALFFNAAFCWVEKKIQALQLCIDNLTGRNLGVGAGVFSGFVNKEFQLRSLLPGKCIVIDQGTQDITIRQTVFCSYSESDPVIPAGPPPAFCVSKLLIDDCSDPSAPAAYFWSPKLGGYVPLGGVNNEPPLCTVHPAQSATIGLPFTFDASEVDPENDALTYTAIGAWPADFSIDPVTGEIAAPANFAAPQGVYALNWTIDDGNNPPVSCALSLTIKVTSTASVETGCDVDETFPEPQPYGGFGIIPNTNPAKLIGGTGAPICGVNSINRLMVNDTTGQLFIDFASPIPATVTSITINSVVVPITGGASSYIIQNQFALYQALCDGPNVDIEIDC